MIFVFAFVVFTVYAQSTTAPAAQASAQTVEKVVSQPKTDWLMAFNRVKVDGPMNVIMRQIPATEAPHIIYDTKGNITSKFKFEISRNGELVITEKYDPKRTSVTDVVICYNTLREVRIAHAKAEFEDVIEDTIFDISVSGGAIVSLNIKTLDIAVECTGQSLLTMGGETKYLTMRASTAKVNCSQLDVVSATIDASHMAEVRAVISERLEATTSTGAKLLYKGYPTILRDHTAIFGGEIININ